MSKPHIPFHVHPSSMDSGSTVESIVDRCVELQKDLPVKYATMTDHGFMGDCFKFYDVCHKKKVRPILGVEGYFKDEDCILVKNTESEKLKYFHIIIHFCDQEAYQKGCELLSDADSRAIVTGGERKPIFTWKDLEILVKYNVTIGTACLLGMASRHLMVNRMDLAAKYYLKLRELCGPDKFYVELLPHVCDRKWEKGIKFHFKNGEKLSVKDSTQVETDQGTMSAIDAYSTAEKQNILIARFFRQQRNEINQEIEGIEKVQDFVEQEGGDIQLKANKFCYAMAKKFGDKIVISDDAHYARPEDKVVQDMRLGENFRFYGSYHLLSSDEASKYFQEVMGINQEEIDLWIQNSYDWASKFDNFVLKYEYSLPVPERDSMEIIGEWIKEMGRMKNDPVYVSRLKHEIKTLRDNGKVDLLPYFLPIKEAIKHYADNGEFSSIGRGSASGCLLAYLIGITHVDPIKYKLSFERFYSIDRAQAGDIPDIDTDFGSRELLVGEDKQSGFLYKKYGECAAQISTRMLMRLKSSIKDVNRFINKGEVESEIDKIAEGLPIPPQGISDQDFVYGYTDSDGHEVEGIIETCDTLKSYIESRPNEWAIVERCLGLARNNSAHASAFAIANRPIKTILPTFSVGGTQNITQYAAPSVERAMIIKYDFLCVAAYKDINSCIKLINKKFDYTPKTAGYFLHQGNEVYLGDLPYSEGAYKDIGDGKTETLFQVSTKAMYPFCRQIKPNSPEDLSIILALCRPGPMDYKLENGRTIAEEYISRRQGVSQPDNEALLKALPDTYGLPIFQENITSIVKEIGGMDPITAEKLRKLMSKKKKTEFDKMKPIFVEGAVSNGLSRESSEQIWSMMETFSRYAFCQAHSQAYGIITYITAFLKKHYPLEWWAAVLTNAEDKEINQTFFRYVKDMLVAPDINYSSEQISIDYDNDKLRSKLSMVAGLGSKLSEKIQQGRPYSSVYDLVSKNTIPEGMARKLIYIGAMDSIFPKDVSVLAKLQAYEDALCRFRKSEKIQENLIKLDSKMCESLNDPKEMSKLQKKKDKYIQELESSRSLTGKIPEDYIGISPLKAFLTKKQLLPTMPMDLYGLATKYYDRVLSAGENHYIEGQDGRTVPLLEGYLFQKVQSKKADRNQNYACCVYILEAKEFVYSKTKRALKMQCDVDGFSTELVLWPNYDTGELTYPDGLTKSMAVLFFFKKEGKDHGRITEIKKLEV